MAKKQPTEIPGRALVDIPALGLCCGEFATLPAEVARQLSEAGEFDPAAKQIAGD